MTIPKIRKGNDFVFILPIERGGEPEDLTAITDGILTASVFSEKKIVQHNYYLIEATDQ